MSVTFSLDGPPTVNDLFRLDHAGRGSHARTVRGIDLLRTNANDLYAGIFAVIDVESDPLAVVDHLTEFEPPIVDLLLPDANWLRPPRRPGRSTGVDYGEWLVRVFDAWFMEQRWGQLRIRILRQLLKLLITGRDRLNTFGLMPCASIVVATDGSLLALDSLKSAYHGAPDLGLNLHDHNFDTALTHPTIVARQQPEASLCATCKACPWIETCGGGYYPHRYAGPEKMFQNPSIYCEDIMFLLRHISDRVRDVCLTLAPPESNGATADSAEDSQASSRQEETPC